MKRVLAAIAIAVFGAGGAQAASFTFDMTWDGVDLTETVPGGDWGGASIAVGDDFELTLRASGNSFWTLDSIDSLPLNPRLQTGASTRANVTMSWFRNGVLIDQIDYLNAWRCCAEIGVSRWTGATIGMEYDTVVMDYELISSRVGRTNNAPIVLRSGIWFNEPRAGEFVPIPDPVQVPLPGSAAAYLGALALGGLMVTRRRRKHQG